MKYSNAHKSLAMEPYRALREFWGDFLQPFWGTFLSPPLCIHLLGHADFLSPSNVCQFFLWEKLEKSSVLDFSNDDVTAYIGQRDSLSEYPVAVNVRV